MANFLLIPAEVFRKCSMLPCIIQGRTQASMNYMYSIERFCVQYTVHAHEALDVSDYQLKHFTDTEPAYKAMSKVSKCQIQYRI